MALTTAQIQQAYVTFFSRPADAAGLNYWSSYNGSVADLYATFAQQAEYTAAFNGLSSSQKVNVVYQNLFGRDAEPTGLLYWAKALDAGTVTVANLALAVSAGAQGADGTTVTNRVTAATAFTAALDTTAEILGYSGATANAAAKTWLSAVKDTAASLTAATAGVDAAVTSTVSVGGAAGSTFTLTTGADTFVGTSSNDTFAAYATYTAAGTQTPQAGSTFTGSDQISGAAGTSDVLNLTIDGVLDGGTTVGGDAVNLVAPTVSGVEVLNIRDIATSTAAADIITVNAGNFTGLTSFNADRSTGGLAVTALTAGASVGVIGNGSVTNGALSATYAAKATGAVLNVSGGTTAGAITLVGADVTGVTINSTGAANTLTSVAAPATTTAVTVNAASNIDVGSITGVAATTAVTVTGAAATVTLGALAANVAKVDATGLSVGGISATIGAVTQTITGGAGKDTITTNGVLTTGSVNAGAGTADKLIVANAADLATTALGAKYTGFEVLQNNAAGNLAASNIAGITGGVVNVATGTGAAGLTDLTATQAADLTVLQTNTAGVTFALADSSGKSDVANIALASATATTNVDAALNVAGFETLNVSATTGTAGTQSDITFVASGATTLTALNITGSAETTLAGGNTTKAMVVNAAAATGKFTASGNFVSGSSVTGSSTAVNTFTVGANEGVTFTGGAGKDVFNATVAQLTADGTTDNVLAGGAGSDKLNITGDGVTVIDNQFTNVTGFETLDFASTTSVSLTSGGSFKTAFADGVTVTAATIADGSTATVALGLYDKAATLALTTAGDGATTADNVTVTTGSAADTVTVSAGSWVGHATTNGAISVTTGAGNDIISVSTGTFLANANANAVVIVAGTGADTISVTHTNSATASATAGIKFTVAAGDSTVSAYDSITGFKMSDIAGTGGKASDGLDFASVTLTAYTATAPAGFSSAEMTVAVSAAGLVTFAGTAAASATLEQKIAAVQSVVVTNAGDSAVFTHGSDTYVFNNNTSGDSLVKLVGISAAALITTNDATTDNGIFIQ